jgi:hypothetical protein
VIRSSRPDHISPILISLPWLSVVFRIQCKFLLNTFKVLHGLSPVYVQDLVRPYNPSRSLRSDDSCLLAKPSVRTKMYGDKRFDFAPSSIWNHLPEILRTESSINVFERNLKTHLFKKPFNLWMLHRHELLLLFFLCFMSFATLFSFLDVLSFHILHLCKSSLFYLSLPLLSVCFNLTLLHSFRSFYVKRLRVVFNYIGRSINVQ